MFNILNSLESLMSEKPPIYYERAFSHSPSSAMCYSAIDNEPIGSCIRAQYLQYKKFPVTNRGGMYMKMTQEAGHIWEEWAVQKFKELGIYISHHSKVSDTEHNIMGELDIVHYNPHTDEIEVTDVKQYNGSNWYAAKEITGSKDSHPKPKDSHLLQMFVYLLTLRNSGHAHIKTCNILYIDRSCGSWDNNFQFAISLFEDGDEIYPQVEYINKFNNNEIEYYVDRRITENNIYYKNSLLEQLIETEVIPPRDYKLIYTAQEVEQKYNDKLISTTAYNKWCQDPVKNSLGDWNCKYCKYGPDLNGNSTCYTLDE